MRGKVIFANMSGSDRDFAWRARGILTHISERVSIFTAAAKQLTSDITPGVRPTLHKFKDGLD